MDVRDIGLLELITPLCHRLASNLLKKVMFHVLFICITMQMLMCHILWYNITVSGMRYSRIKTSAVSSTCFYSLLLQICGAVCSRHVALHHPDYDFLEIFHLSICWGIPIVSRCDWLSCFRSMKSVIWLDESIFTPSDLYQPKASPFLHFALLHLCEPKS